MIAEIVCLWLDTERTGCGWRNYVALPGRKWVRLVMLSTGESVRLSMADYEKAYARRHAIAAQRRRDAARRLRRNAKTFGNLDSTAVKDALSALRALIKQTEAVAQMPAPTADPNSRPNQTETFMPKKTKAPAKKPAAKKIRPFINRATAAKAKTAKIADSLQATAEAKGVKVRDLGQRAVVEAAAAGKLPNPPDFSAKTHERFRGKLKTIVDLVGAKDVKALKAIEINPVSSSPKALARYRDLAVIALEAQAKAA